MDKQLELENMQYTSTELFKQVNQSISITKLLQHPLNKCFELANQIAWRQDNNLVGDRAGLDEMTAALFNTLQVVESLVGLGLSCEDKASALKAYFEAEGE